MFDTLDVATRLGRYLVQELTGLRSNLGAWVGTLITLGVPVLVIWTTPDDGWVKFWTLFGASNQLLAALTLLAVTLWLYQAKKRIAFTLIPMIFVLITTLTALVIIAKTSWESSQGVDASLINAVVSIALIALAIFICAAALKKVKASKA